MILSRLFTPATEGLDAKETAKKRIINGFSIWTIIVFFIFGTLYLIKGEMVIGLIEVGTALLLCGNLYTLRVRNTIKSASTVLLLSVYFMTYVIFVSGGVGGTGNLWILFMPLYTMLLIGNSHAKRWLIGYVVVLLLIVFAGYSGIYTLHYTLVELRQTLIVFLVFVILNTINEHTKEGARKIIEEKNRELERLSTTDYLTGIANRYCTSRFLDHELFTSARYSLALSIIMVDIDRFKQINDTYGHEAGDVVLKRVSVILSTHMRSADMLGRWGGEEFLIICPSTPLEGASVIAETLRKAVEKEHFGDIVQLTASFGVAAYTPSETVEILVKKADEALYRAKADGRNKTVVYGEEVFGKVSESAVGEHLFCLK